MTENVGLGATEIRTFLIADVRGYTHFTTEHGDEAGARLAARFAEVVREQIDSRGGTVVELRGDEALCVFGSPRGALRAAVDLQRRFADELRADPSLPLRVGIGIDAGEAVAVSGGYRGGALNLAARLCSIAGPGEVLVSEGIVHLARHVDEMSYVDRGRVELKGMAEPVHVMQVKFELDMPVVASVVGRWTPARVAAMAMGGLVVVAALVVLVGTRGGAAHPASLGANVVGVLDASGHVVSQIPLRGHPGGVASGNHSVWATDSEHDSVVQLDSAGRVVGRIPVGIDPTGVAVGGGGVWVADSGSGAVSWVSASSPGQSTPIPVGQGPGAIAYGESAVWVVNATDGTLQKIDSHSLKPTGNPIAIGGAPTAVSVGGGSVWVTDTSSNAVVEVNPRTRAVVDRLAVGNNPVAVAFGGDRLWVANAADGTITRLDPTTNRTKVIPVGRNPTDVAYSNGAVWVAVGEPASVARIDPVSSRVAFTPTNGLPQAIAGVGDRTWVTVLASSASHRGGTLRVVFSSDNFMPKFSSFDPGVAMYRDSWQVLSQTNDGLVTYRRAGSAGGVQVVPDLAVTMPTVSEGGLVYSFKLRTGIHYSSGRLVRASDFRFAIERQFLPAALRLDVDGYAYFQREMFSNLVGYGACARSYPCHLAGAIKTDDQTGSITIHLSRPDPNLLLKLATTFGDLVPPGSPSPASGRPVPATGPYVIARTYQNGADGFLMVRNRQFHQWSADAQPRGYPDQIEWRHVVDAGSELTAVEAGTADVMTEQPPFNRLTELRAQDASLAHVYVSPTTTFLALNTRVPPFNRASARRAVNLAVDRDQVAKLFGGSQLATPTCQILPPGMLGYAPYCPYTANPTPSGAWSAPDVAQAQQLVRSSGTTRAPVTVSVCGTESTGNLATVGYLKGVLATIGYNASTRVFGDCRKFFAAIADPRSRIQASGPLGWGADFPAPTAFFDVLLTCQAVARKGNPSEFCDRHLDSHIRQAEDAQPTDPPRAARLWQGVDQEAVNQAPWVPLTNSLGVDVVSHRVGNYQHNPQWGTLLDQLWVK